MCIPRCVWRRGGIHAQLVYQCIGALKLLDVPQFFDEGDLCGGAVEFGGFSIEEVGF